MTEENIFSTIDDNIEQLQIDNTFGPQTSTDDLTPASEEDKKQAAEKGKADSDKEKAAAAALAEKAKKEEEEARKLIDKDFMEDDPESKLDTENQKNPKAPKEEVKDLSYLEELAKDLEEIGIFSPTEEGEERPKTQEEFTSRWQKEKEAAAEDLLGTFINKYGTEYGEMFDAIFVDGVSPKEYIAKFQQIQSFKEMDLKIEDNQVAVVRTALRKQGWDETDIEDKIKSLKLNSELESDSLRYHKALVKIEEQEKASLQENAKIKHQQKQAQEEQYKANLRNMFGEKLKTKDFNGIPITKDIANKAIDALETKKWKLPDGELITDWDYAILELNKPQNHEAKAMLQLLLDFQPGKPIKLNLGSVVTTAASKEKKDLFNFNTRNRNTEPKKETGKTSDFFKDM